MASSRADGADEPSAYAETMRLQKGGAVDCAKPIRVDEQEGAVHEALTAPSR